METEGRTRVILEMAEQKKIANLIAYRALMADEKSYYTSDDFLAVDRAIKAKLRLVEPGAPGTPRSR